MWSYRASEMCVLVLISTYPLDVTSVQLMKIARPQLIHTLMHFRPP